LDLHSQAWPAALSDVAEQHAANWVLELQEGALLGLFERFARSVHRDDTLLAQMLRLAEMFRQYEAQGRLRLWWRRGGVWPLPSLRATELALDALCPVGQAAVVGVFKRGELYTCLALRRSRQGFDRVVGPSVLRPRMGLLSGDWTRDYRYLLAATEELVGPPCVGCFGELLTFQSLSASKRPGAWAQAIAMREIILSPVVPALALPLGIDVGLAALGGVRALAERAHLRDWLSPRGPLRGVLNRLQSSGANMNPKSLLGFDPLALFYELVQKHEPRE
jgi:hypothetical protein